MVAFLGILRNSPENSPLRVFLYPLAHLIMGCVKLVATAQYMPLCFHCCQPLTRLSKETGIPSNPFKSNSIWVGNVTKSITEDLIKPLFSKFGKIKSIIVQHQNFCAFVNYMEPSMAANAMKKFHQHYPIADTFLVIRYPDNAKANAMMFGNKKNGIKIK
ncbi:hypothetical protein J6590_091495 [Homalodisca vitripennis]|nr:hypothetical protein J6590_036349 [Homalodisca vitripennis]KAG8324479.1 hypothetical protein J6590_091495 [Homalodisca vitripennis]